MDKIKGKMVENDLNRYKQDKKWIITKYNQHFKNVDVNDLEVALKNYTIFHNIIMQDSDLFKNIDILKKIIDSSAQISGWAKIN